MRSRTGRSYVNLSLSLVMLAGTGGCISTPWKQYEYAKYSLLGAGYLTDADVENLNTNGRNGWRATQVINEKYILLERER